MKLATGSGKVLRRREGVAPAEEDRDGARRSPRVLRRRGGTPAGEGATY